MINRGNHEQSGQYLFNRKVVVFYEKIGLLVYFNEKQINLDRLGVIGKAGVPHVG